MTDCTTCHRPAFGPAVGPTLTRGALPVTRLFDHAAHAAKQPADARAECLACHSAIAETDGEALPSPTMAMCASCHDGARAFSTTATRCRSCHQPAPATRPEHRARAPFSHARHAALEAGAARACAECHRLEPDGRVGPPAADHQPCASAPCHADEFAALQPTICSTCHIGSEPWRALRWFPLPARASEYALAFSHATHTLDPARCTDCHVDDGARRPVSGGHGACAGQGCHLPDTDPVPLRTCERCHTPAAATRANTGAASTRWSVGSTFRHDVHDGPCAACHLTPANDGGARSLARPDKARCATCHDGETAFKMTGHACSRCHAK